MKLDNMQIFALAAVAAVIMFISGCCVGYLIAVFSEEFK